MKADEWTNLPPIVDTLELPKLPQALGIEEAKPGLEGNVNSPKLAATTLNFTSTLGKGNWNFRPRLWRALTNAAQADLTSKLPELETLSSLESPVLKIRPRHWVVSCWRVHTDNGSQYCSIIRFKKINDSVSIWSYMRAFERFGFALVSVKYSYISKYIWNHCRSSAKDRVAGSDNESKKLQLRLLFLEAYFKISKTPFIHLIIFKSCRDSVEPTKTDFSIILQYRVKV